MDFVRLLGFTTFDCGCLCGRYRELGTNREIRYIEEKGEACHEPDHLRNQPLTPGRVAHGFDAGSRAS